MKKKQKNIFIILCTLVVLFLGAYGYLVNKTVWNVVARQNAVKEIQRLSSDIATLESSYMTVSKTLTLNHAYTLGFKDVPSSDTIFVEQTVTSVARR